MTKRGWIRHAAGRGQWIYGPQLTKIFRTFEKVLVEEVCKPLGYTEMIFPKLVTWDVWKRSGHAKGIYPEAYYVCTPKTRDPEFWEDVMDYYKVTNEVPIEMITERIENIGGMCYAQCPPFWVFLQGRILPDEILPITVFDRSGPSYRYESGGLHGIERLDEFHRVELVWIGKRQQVIEHAQRLREKYRVIFDELLDIEWREAWVTPWFMAQEGRGGLAELKEVGTVDYEALLPYSGKWLEFQNVSVNGDKYPKGFSVKLQSGEELWSGCSGVGLERWAAVFLGQKGLEHDKWPEKFCSIIGELPEVLRFL
jgi:seryl-tRNA synthetase